MWHKRTDQTQVAEDGILSASFCKNCNGHLNSVSSKEFLDYLQNSWLLNKYSVRPKNLKGDGIEEPCSLPNLQTPIVCRRDRSHCHLECLDLNTLVHTNTCSYRSAIRCKGASCKWRKGRGFEPGVKKNCSRGPRATGNQLKVFTLNRQNWLSAAQWLGLRLTVLLCTVSKLWQYRERQKYLQYSRVPGPGNLYWFLPPFSSALMTNCS